MDLIIAFGRKHKNTHIRVVYETDIEYCRWCYRQTFIKYQYPKIYEFLDSKFKKPEHDIKIIFGKYKNLYLSDICKAKDIKYLLYLYNLSFVKNHIEFKKLYKAIDKIIKDIDLENYNLIG